jgi:hypothetical protein
MLQTVAWSEADEVVLGADGVLFRPTKVSLAFQDGYQFAGVSETGFVQRRTVWQTFCTNQFIQVFFFTAYLKHKFTPVD